MCPESVATKRNLWRALRAADIAALDRLELDRLSERATDQLERLLKARVTLFSYPFGSHDAFDAATTQLVRDSGYALACTGTGGLARQDHYPFRIPRNVVGDWDAETFERWLDHWLEP